MAARALFDCLPDFGEAPGPVFPLNLPDIGGMPAMEPEAPVPAPDVDAIVAAEVAAADDRLRAELEAEKEAALAAEREHHAAEMQAMQASLGEAAAARIAAAFDDAEARLSTLTTAAVARLLSSVLGDDMARRSVEELSAAIRRIVADRDAVQIHVSGPQSLVEGLAASLGPVAERCDFSEAPGFDVTAVIDGTILETRLAEWSALVGEAVS